MADKTVMVRPEDLYQDLYLSMLFTGFRKKRQAMMAAAGSHSG